MTTKHDNEALAETAYAVLSEMQTPAQIPTTMTTTTTMMTATIITIQDQDQNNNNNNNNKRTNKQADWISIYPRLAQISLPWQQGSAHNILHGSIESAISQNLLEGPNISGLSAIQADL